MHWCGSFWLVPIGSTRYRSELIGLGTSRTDRFHWFRLESGWKNWRNFLLFGLYCDQNFPIGIQPVPTSSDRNLRGTAKTSNGHASECHRDSTVQSSAELDHDGLQVGVLSIAYEVLELIQIGLDRPVALEVFCHLKSIDSSSFSTKGKEVLLKLFLKVEPIQKAKSSIARFSFKLDEDGQFTDSTGSDSENKSDKGGEAQASDSCLPLLSFRVPKPHLYL